MQKALAAVPGVRKATANHEKKIAVVSFDPKKASVDDLIAAAKKAGFEAKPK